MRNPWREGNILVTCPVCEGLGGALAVPEMDIDEERCDFCDGTGEVSQDRQWAFLEECKKEEEA